MARFDTAALQPNPPKVLVTFRNVKMYTVIRTVHVDMC